MARQLQFHGLTEYERFMRRVQVGDPSACWEWTASRKKKRWHGQWRNGAGKIELAHRAAWRLLRGEIPAGLCVLHRCDNPACCNPCHLFLGTHSDNFRDMWAKGRARPKANRGQEHGNAKLTADLVRDIRTSKEAGTVLAHRLGITATTVCDVRRRRTWRHVA